MAAKRPPAPTSSTSSRNQIAIGIPPQLQDGSTRPATSRGDDRPPPRVYDCPSTAPGRQQQHHHHPVDKLSSPRSLDNASLKKPYLPYLAGDDGGSSTSYEFCVLWLLLGSRARPVYSAMNSAWFLIPAAALMVVGLAVGTVAAVSSTGAAGGVSSSGFALLILPLYLQRLLTLDYVVLRHLLGEFEALFVLANWILMFPCLGRLFGLGWRLLYFALVALVLLPSLVCDASRGTNRTVFRNILSLSLSITVMCVWVYEIEAERVPGAWYDKPLLLREDRLAEAVGPAKDVLTSRLFILIVFCLKYLYNSVVTPMNYVLLRLPLRRLETGEEGEGEGEGNGEVVTPLEERKGGNM